MKHSGKLHQQARERGWTVMRAHLFKYDPTKHEMVAERHDETAPAGDCIEIDHGYEKDGQVMLQALVIVSMGKKR